LTPELENTDAQSLPFVSLVMPVRNESKYIGPAIDSIVESTYPKELIELIVVDGQSSDETIDIANRYQDVLKITVLSNTKRTVPGSMNLGIEQAQGEIIVRLDAHAIYSSRYISSCVNLLLTTNAWNVGGTQNAIGETLFGKAVALAVNSRLGAGSSYDVRSDNRWTDTVFLGAWWKKTLAHLGGFDEDWTVNQDYELNLRIRQAGGGILYSPDIEVSYFTRSTPKSLFRQFFRYGKWRVKTLNKYPAMANPKHFLPPLALMAMVIGLIATAAGYYQPIAVLGIGYLGVLVWITAPKITAGSPRVLLQVPISSIILHLSWSMGFWAGLLKFGIPKITIYSRNSVAPPISNPPK